MISYRPINATYSFLIILKSYIYTAFLVYITKDCKRCPCTLDYYSLVFN